MELKYPLWILCQLYQSEEYWGMKQNKVIFEFIQMLRQNHRE